MSYVLSPATKGRVERPYRWIQDHFVRTGVRDGMPTIEQAREVLDGELTPIGSNGFTPPPERSRM